MAGSVYSAAASGDRRAALEAVRDKLAQELEGLEGPAVAVVSKELRATIAELESIPGGREVSAVDDLSKRRAARRADAQGGDVPAGGQQRGT
ncbi:hypothetical protein VM95_19790 [Streptomyces rubellomurinus]|uniref:Uncharacterized protein n=2 Tax=Streptomyces rubellomurinus (strain ATCC 31215) TaxID=359131 RepID=A0A0F2TG27_STRR3|nr:hypothetical protein VM95_19790 [Streptomyces rubellomurinus]